MKQSHVKKNQLDARLILSIFHLLSWLDCSNPAWTTDSHLKRIISSNCCIRTVVPPDDGPRYTRNT